MLALLPPILWAVPPEPRACKRDQSATKRILSVRVLKMGGAGDTLRLARPGRRPADRKCGEQRCEKAAPLARTAAPVPSGESPDGTGESPVLPVNPFSKHASQEFPPKMAFPPSNCSMRSS